MAKIHMQNAAFAARVDDVVRRHGKAQSGYVRLEVRDGVLAPVERRRVGFGASLRGIVYALGVLFALKAFLLFSLGTVTYTNRVAALDAGSIVEKMAGWMMQADPATQWIVAQINQLI